MWQVYGMDGELVAEYAAGAATTAPQKEYGYRNGEVLVAASSGANVQWMVTDQLGTARMVADRTGSLVGVKRHDYMPFGEELFAGTGGRTSAQGYVTDSLRQKFTGYERDNETGLDYAEARYYSSTMGRFTSPDDFLNDTITADPQSWNLYGYVRNNPLRYVDPSGTIITNADGTVLFVTNQENVTRTYGMPNQPLGNGHTLTITGQVDAGWVFADDGTPIPADRSLGSLTVTERDANGDVVDSRQIDQVPGGAGYTNVADCHGVTFANGEVWINNQDVPGLMQGDGYSPVATPMSGDVGIYSGDGTLNPNQIVHSVTVVDVSNGQATGVRSNCGITSTTVPNSFLRGYRWQHLAGEGTGIFTPPPQGP